MLTWNAGINNEAQNEKWMKCPMCPWVLYRWRMNVRGKVRLSRLMKTSVGRWCGRCEKLAKRALTSRRWCGADERVGGVKWCSTRWWCSESLRCDAPWSRGWRADGGNERDDEVGDRQACVSDGCGARRMQLGRWWGWWRCWLATMALTGQWVARRYAVESQWWWRSTSSSESCQQTV